MSGRIPADTAVTAGCSPAVTVYFCHTDNASRSLREQLGAYLLYKTLKRGNTMSSSATGGTGRTGRTTGDSTDIVRKLALVVGAMFVLVGILGFVPGITTNFDEMEFAGDGSGALLLGLFQVSILHNLVHLLYGVAGLAMSRASSTARTYLLVGGAIYLVLWVYGLIVVGGDEDGSSAANFVPLNDADNWLHLGLGIVMILMGMAGRRETTRTTTA